MKITLVILTVGIMMLVIPLNFSEPGFNGSSPGCDGSGCHALEDGIVSVSVSVSDLDVSITVNGTTSSVAGELVDSNGTVVAENNSTSNNPFTLAAPGPGNYIVNAGFKNPDPRRWDSAMVSIIVTNITENNHSPISYKLYNNHPNPFNPSTLIKYSVANESYTSLKIYDALGNEVITLVDDVKAAGTHQVIFDASGLSSGIYYYTLQSGSFTETKKMNLLK
jgi:hypothetical protein